LFSPPDSSAVQLLNLIGIKFARDNTKLIISKASLFFLNLFSTYQLNTW
jgi:hypothetical protein